MKHYDHPSVKTKRTYYTDEKMQNALKNIEKYDWAKSMRDKAVKAADEYLDYGIDRLLVYVTQQNLPRSYGVNQMKGCPVCGKGIDKYGNYPWLTDALGRPFKLTCPNCRSVFPSNDFDAYYKSGLDENGRFHYDKADPVFLKNELYPDKPSDWCTDNGFGWIDPEGCKTKSFSHVFDKEKGSLIKETTTGDNRYTFIAYFNHWSIWSENNWGHRDKNLVTGAISKLKDAYLYTKDAKYARAGLVLLNRVADFYPEFDATVYKWEDNFRHSGGAWGKIIGSIWEEGIVDCLSRAYDAFFPAIDESALALIQSMPFYQNNPDTPVKVQDIPLNIENNILYQIWPEVRNHRIRGNFGMHQGSIALAALVLQNEDYFNRSIDAILSTTDGEHWGVGNILKILVDEIDHDGCGNETAVGYNGIWINGMNGIAKILKDTSRDLYGNPRFLKMHQLELPYLIADRYSLNIGDTSNAGSPFTTIYTEPRLSLFLFNEDVKSAQLLALDADIRRAKGDSESLVQSMFTDCEAVEAKIKRVIEKEGPFKSPGENFSGFGIAKYETRNGGQEPKSTWMYYGRNTGHGHRDTLMLGFYGYGVFLNPDHGYPCFADGNHERRCWTVNTISHDTVMVDDRPGTNHVVGIPHHFDTTDNIGVMDVEAPLIYKQTDCYRRTAVTVNLFGAAYTADFFRVSGGKDHRYVFHGAEGDAKTDGLTTTAQKTGTYAGEDIPFASVAYDEKHHDGFNYLYDVRKDQNVTGHFTVDWKVKDTFGVWKNERDVHFAVTLVDPPKEAVLAKGKPPQNKPGNPAEYTYLIVHNSILHEEGNADTIAKSQFVSVVESYENHRSVAKVASLPIKALDGTDVGIMAKAIVVTMADGRRDYLFNAVDNRTYQVGDDMVFKGFCGVICEEEGNICYRYANDLTYLSFKGKVFVDEAMSVSGMVVGFTRDMNLENKILVALDRDIDPSMLAGRYTDIETDKTRNGFYKILSAEKTVDGLVALYIGDISLVRAMVDPMDISKGFVYNIEEGAKMRIALTEEM